MERGRGGTHHDCSLLEGNFRRERKHTPGRNCDELGIAAITIFSDHRARGAELVGALCAVRTAPATGQVMEANSVARFETDNLPAYLLDDACDLMSQGQR